MQTLVIEGPMNEMAEKKIKKLNNEIDSGKHIFLFLFMVGCGPCNSTKEPWLKIKTYLKEEHTKNPNIVVAMVDKDFYPKLTRAGKEPIGFPTLRYISANDAEEYEDAKLDVRDRSAKSFADWIELKVGKKGVMKGVMKGGKMPGHTISCKKAVFKRRAGGRRNRTRRGGKWSLKYKRSIDCKRPKGFSQKQHCKSKKNRKN
uniref:Thioredoxin domain-containing protein n=1 Tax=viral metagenome TaxID=1070528 RepID=A0A6C0B9F6_9ZZZZ